MPRVMIPAAGKSERFGGKNKLFAEFLFKGRFARMIDHVMEALPAHLRREVVIGSQEDIPGWQSHVQIVPETRGQAETLAILMHNEALGVHAEPDALVLNCDMVFDYPVEVFYDQCEGSECELGVLVKATEDPSWSYITDYPIFQSAVEKKVIAPKLGLAGLYYFRNIREASARLRATCKDQVDEPYLSNGMWRFAPCLAIHTGSCKVHDFGTPGRIRTYDSSFRPLGTLS